MFLNLNTQKTDDLSVDNIMNNNVESNICCRKSCRIIKNCSAKKIVKLKSNRCKPIFNNCKNTENIWRHLITESKSIIRESEQCKVTTIPVSEVIRRSWCTWQLLRFILLVLVLTTSNIIKNEVLGQRAPCYECELYRDSHPHTNTYEQIRARCVYPCECANTPPSCTIGQTLGRDSCGCCWQCFTTQETPGGDTGAAPHGNEDPAMKVAEGTVCDSRRNCGKGLVCSYTTPGESGLCSAESPKPCLVNGTFYRDGETFLLDCRTQCTCRSSAYACVSLCPGEALPPSSKCRNPQLVAPSGRCCRDWTCDPDPDLAAPPEGCEMSVSRWSACSSLRCGLGLSQRWATDRRTCRPELQTRLCELRPCSAPAVHASTRQIRRGHHCKATIHSDNPQRLVAGPCVSEKRYRRKHCNSCVGSCCSSFLDTSLDVTFLCPLHGVPPYLLPDKALSPTDQAMLFAAATESQTMQSKLGDLTEDGEERYHNVTATNFEIVHKQVQWIMRCRCAPTCLTPTLLPHLEESSELVSDYIDAA